MKQTFLAPPYHLPVSSLSITSIETRDVVQDDKDCSVLGPAYVVVAYGSGFLKFQEVTLDPLYCGSVIEIGEGESAHFSADNKILGPDDPHKKYGMRLVVLK